MKRALKNDIKITTALAPSSGMGDVPPPPPSREDPDHGRRRRRLRAHASPEPAAKDPDAQGGAARVPVHRRLGFGPMSGGHVADREERVDGWQPPDPNAT